MRLQPASATRISRAARAATVSVAAVLLLGGCGLTDARNSAIADAKVTPNNMADSLRPGLVGMPDYPSSGWEPGEATPSPTPSASPTTPAPNPANPLAAIGLNDNDLTSGSRVAVLADGTSLGIPTLDFCDAKYPSESLRVKRLQTGAFDSDGVYAGMSTEVVVYESSKAAKQALAEVIKARLACPEGKKITTFDGHTLVFTFHKAPGPSDTPLVGADSRLIIHTTMLVDGAPQTAFLVYQIAGPVLAALYVSDASGKPLTQASLDSVYGLAGRIATRLQLYVGDIDLADIPGHTTQA